MKILFEDGGIIVCVKPCGLLSQSDSGGADNMVTCLENLTGGDIYPLHRLDREVGGVMVFAKTKPAAAALSRDIAERRFKKEYLAMVHGVPDAESGVFRDLLFKDSRRNKVYTVSRMRKGVREAELCYSVIETKGEYSLISVILKTGRTHQIRVQFASRGMPLAGDRRYGARDDFKNIGLWSHRLEFVNPVTKVRQEFEYLPENFMREYFNMNM